MEHRKAAIITGAICLATVVLDTAIRRSEMYEYELTEDSAVFIFLGFIAGGLAAVLTPAGKSFLVSLAVSVAFLGFSAVSEKGERSLTTPLFFIVGFVLVAIIKWLFRTESKEEKSGRDL